MPDNVPSRGASSLQSDSFLSACIFDFPSSIRATLKRHLLVTSRAGIDAWALGQICRLHLVIAPRGISRGVVPKFSVTGFAVYS